jgi:triosephosphate isomerase
MMTASIRVPVLAGNWKMNLAPTEAADFFPRFTEAYSARDDRTVVFFPPAISFAAARAATRGRPDLLLGVQNVHWETKGAFTGEISAVMAADAGARFALCGHSERRHVFGETDADVGRKVAAVLAAGLTPVLCVGETLDERRSGRLEEVLTRQLDAVLATLPDAAERRFLIAYEPVWAIGTGLNATPEDAAAAHAFLRDCIRPRAGGPAATTPILYGGSVKPDNAADLLAAEGVDGLLVGGASLDPGGFARIARAGALD